MINLKDIQTAVADILKQNGYTVTASEVEQGFSKPTFFVDVLPVSVLVQNRYSELVTVSVELSYHPQIETREHLVEVSESIKNMFLYNPIPVCDRFLSVYEILFDADKSALVTYFEIEFMQETNITEKEYPKMKNLQTEVKQNYGTATNNNPV
jgi:hypothetical protein